FAALLCRLHEDFEVVEHLGLADVFVEAARPQRHVVVELGRVDQARAGARSPRVIAVVAARTGHDVVVLFAHGLLYSASRRSAAFTSSATPAPGWARVASSAARSASAGL